MSNDPQPQPQPELAERSTTLREELKAWEKSFVASNGRKAGRDDIKRDRSIASKYKEYNKLRDRLSNKHTLPSEPSPPTKPSPSTTNKKRKAVSQHAHTHTPRRLPPSTPSRDVHPADLDPYDSPLSVRKLLFVNEPRTCIRPTPQKNGKVLGLFDLLEENKADSPLKTRKGALLDGSSNVQATPRRGGGADGRLGWKSEGSTPVARTPASSGKRRLYEAFNTPLKRQRLGDGDGGPALDAQFATPSFLRRDKQGVSMLSTIGEDGEPIPVSPIVRMPAKPPIRGLSSMLARLRQIEDEALDEEMDVLREMELEASGQPTKLSSTKSVSTALAGDGQVAPGDGTPNNANDSESRDGVGDGVGEKPVLGRDGKPLKVWKKKGQKRTTRRVILRPVRMRPKHTPGLAIDESDTGGEETKAASTANATTSKSSRKDTADNGDYELSDVDINALARTGDDGSQDETSKNSHNTKDSSRNTESNASQEGAKASLARRAVKKISSQAHANFRRLKLRNKNSKGKGSGGRMGFKRRR
ncbi:hypothetical protein FGG08_003489 [Glutinoglossum americanum]|uniref:DNA replication regulator SLD2 n=1 Tax=Glutinoglossum americanum TaxID=1670608 RepID=A0A9P8L4Q8_9PEZI|nr:hypothetical protein FGG08_003489 [Glutinoglossum americanum]